MELSNGEDHVITIPACVTA